MNYFRMRPMATFSVAFFLCSLFASYFAPLYAVFFAALSAAVLFVLLILLGSPADTAKRQTRLALCALLLAPVLSLSLFAYRAYSAQNAVPKGSAAAITGTVRSKTSSSGGIAVYLMDIRSVDGADTSFLASVSCGDAALAAGDTVSAAGVFSPVGSAFLDGERYLRSLGAVAEAELEGVILTGKDESFTYRLAALREDIGVRISRYAGTSAPLITALTVGDRSDLEPEVKRAFSELGISHLLAISGVHMSVLFSAAAIFMRPFGRRRILLLIPAILAFAAITGFSSSALRAGTMMIICSLCELIGRRTDRVTVLWNAVLLITLFSPGAIYDVGLLLSALSVFALSILPQRKKRKKEKGAKKALRALAATVAATAAVSVVTLPVTAREYGAVSLIAPLANILFIPAITLILLAAPIFLLSTFVPVLALPLGRALDFYASLVCRLAKRMSGGGRYLLSLDYPLFGVLSLLLCLGFVAVFLSRKKRLPIFVTALLAMGMVISGAGTELLRLGEIRIAASAESSGDIIALTDGSALFFVDSARGSKTFIRTLKSIMRDQAVTRVEKYVFTHYHTNSDVYLQNLLASLRVREVALPVPQKGEEWDVCLRMVQIALDADVRPTMLEGEISLGAAGLALSPRSEIPQSAECAFALNITHLGDSFTYISSGYFDTTEDFRAQTADMLGKTILIGGHGSKPKNGYPVGGPDPILLTEGNFCVLWSKK